MRQVLLLQNFQFFVAPGYGDCVHVLSLDPKMPRRTTPYRTDQIAHNANLRLNVHYFTTQITNPRRLLSRQSQKIFQHLRRQVETPDYPLGCQGDVHRRQIDACILYQVICKSQNSNHRRQVVFGEKCFEMMDVIPQIQRQTIVRRIVWNLAFIHPLNQITW